MLDLSGKFCHHLFSQQIDTEDQTGIKSPTQEEEVPEKPLSTSELLVLGTSPVHVACAHPAAPQAGPAPPGQDARLHSPHMSCLC